MPRRARVGSRAGNQMNFLKDNWFSIFAALFSSGGFVATVQFMRVEVTAVAAKTELTATAQVDLAARTKALEVSAGEARDDMKAVRASAESTARNVAALCEKAAARCQN